MTYRINTPLRNYFFYKSGPYISTPLANGFINFFEDGDHSTYLTVYQDPELTIPCPNPLVLDSDGGCPPIYMQDAPYYIEVWSDDDTGEQLQFTLSDYEGALLESGIFPPSVTNANNNLFIDGQFLTGLFTGSDFASPPSGEPFVISQAGWEFFRNGTATDTINFGSFPLGQTTPDQNPINYLAYSVTSATEETVCKFYYPFQGVRTLQDTQVTFSFWASGAIGSVVTPYYTQYFGTGGTPSPTNTVLLNPVTLNGSWTQYSQTVTIASLDGKLIGTNGGDRLEVGINLPTNAIFNDIAFTNMLLQEGNMVNDYPYQSEQQIYAQIPQVPVAALWYFNLIAPPIGWLEATGDAVSRSTYRNLYLATTIITSGACTSGSGVVTGLPANLVAAMYVGMQVTATNFTGILTISSIDSTTQITLSGNAGASGSTTLSAYLNGAGDGSTTFNLPYLARHTLIGRGGTATNIVGNVVGQPGGSETETLFATSQLPPTTVTIPSTTNAGIAELSTGSGSLQLAAGSSSYFIQGAATLSSASFGASAPFSIMQPSYVALGCIKY